MILPNLPEPTQLLVPKLGSAKNPIVAMSGLDNDNWTLDGAIGFAFRHVGQLWVCLSLGRWEGFGVGSGVQRRWCLLAGVIWVQMSSRMFGEAKVGPTPVWT